MKILHGLRGYWILTQRCFYQNILCRDGLIALLINIVKCAYVSNKRAATYTSKNYFVRTGCIADTGHV